MTRIARYTLLGLFLMTMRAEDGVETPLARHILSNQAIVALCEAGYDESFVLDLIQYKQTRFDTTVEGLTFLAKHGISERIVRSMIVHANKPATSPVDSAAAPQAAPPAVAVRARVVRQRVLMPEVRATQQPVPVAITGTRAQTINAPWTDAVFQYAAPVAAPYVMLKRHLFWKRWYVVNPSYAPAAPAAPLLKPEPAPMPATSQFRSLPPW